MRTALTADDIALGKRLAASLKSRYPLDEHALCTVRAELADAEGDISEAVQLYAEAAARWDQFGNVPERAHALLGKGRCLLILGAPGAGQPLREARDLFAAMGYNPLLSETDALIEQTAAASAS